MRDIIGWMLGTSDRIDLYCRITSGSNRRRLKTKVDKPNWQLLHRLWEKWRSLHESVTLRATIGVNSPYHPRKKSFRMASKGLIRNVSRGLYIKWNQYPDPAAQSWTCISSVAPVGSLYYLSWDWEEWPASISSANSRPISHYAGGACNFLKSSCYFSDWNGVRFIFILNCILQ